MMDVFAGLVILDRAPIPHGVEDRIVNALPARRTGAVSVSRCEHALFARQMPSPSGVPKTGVRSRDNGDNGHFLFAAAARLDNREELGSAFGIDGGMLGHLSDATLVRRVFESRGDAGLATILGAFAFAHWDEDACRLTLGRDCLGNATLFYCIRPQFVAFATTLNGLLALPRVPREIDEVLLGHFVALNLRESRGTLYRGIERVPSRTRVTIDSAGARLSRYWSPNLQDRPLYSNELDYVERARELLDQAVTAAMRDTPRAALLLSGGLDSTAIAATCARLGFADRIECFTGVPPRGVQPNVGQVFYADERSKVEALNRLHPALNVNYVTPPDVHRFDTDAARYFARYGLPVRNAVNLGWFSGINDMIDSKIGTTLIGAAGNLGLTWDGKFSLIELFCAGHFKRFMHELMATARQSGQSVGRTFQNEVAVRMMPDRLYRLYHRFRGRNPDDITRYSMLNTEFAADHGLAARWQSQGHDPYFGTRGTNGAKFRALYLFDHNQLGRDAFTLDAKASGRSILDPHADRRLLEFALAVPERLYRQNGVPRSFARRVLADRLPPEILNERRRGEQAPRWFRTLDARREDIARDIDRIEASPLARRMLDVPRMKRLMADWPKDESAAQARKKEYRFALARGVHAGLFIRWVEGGNA
jgi:asparagine synthase (glutamine-hydrolysing)